MRRCCSPLAGISAPVPQYTVSRPECMLQTISDATKMAPFHRFGLGSEAILLPVDGLSSLAWDSAGYKCSAMSANRTDARYRSVESPTYLQSVYIQDTSRNMRF